MSRSNLKHEQRRAQLRALWCEWDPIGVLSDPDWPRDEYDDYLDPVLKRLESGAGVAELAHYLNSVVGEQLALGDTGVMSAKPLLFASKMRDWFDAEHADAAPTAKRQKRR
jgi:hypothetical protein